MAEKGHSTVKSKKEKVPLAIHPDDAKDKVFAAILKALMKMGNTPSSPRELANTIVKHKYATLGGQTPFATVSSRISQHFKRAAQHNPPRAPLLTKHVDQNHSRKINYSLATNAEKKDMTTKEDLSDSSNLSSEEEIDSPSPIVKQDATSSTILLSLNDDDQLKQLQQQEQNDDDIAAAIAITKLSQQANKKKLKSNDSKDEQHSDYYEEMMLEDTVTGLQQCQPSRNASTTAVAVEQDTSSSMNKPTLLSAVGENEYWASFSFEQEFDSVFLSSSADNQPATSNQNFTSPVSEFDTMILSTTTKCNVNTPPPSTSPPPSQSYHRAESILSDNDNSKENASSMHTRRSSWPNDCKLASSFTAGEEVKSGKKERFEVITSTLKGHTYRITKKWIDDMEFYELDSPDDIPDTKVLRFIASSNQHVALKYRYRIGTTASNIFDVQKDMTNLQEGYVNATQLRKAATAVLGEGEFDLEAEKKQNEAVVIVITKGSLEGRGAWVPLHRARELVEDFEIESSPGLTKLLSDDPLDDGSSIEQDFSLSNQASSLDFSSQLTNTLINETNQGSANEKTTKLPFKPKDKEPAANESLIVQFEQSQNEKKTPAIIPTIPPASPSPQPLSQLVPAPPAKVRKHTKIAPSTKHLSTSEILKSMNIQNLNLTALQHMMTAIPNIAQPQNLTFAENLETYMQTMKATTSSNPSANTTIASIQDLKSILSRIPLFDALLTQKQQQQQHQVLLPSTSKAFFSDSNTSTTASSPTSSTSSSQNMTTIISSPIASISTEPLVIYPTVPTEPSMFITVIDNVAVCIAILRKQEIESQVEKEYRVMRRLDNGYINGTQLLTAGGIETESERSMILSFEMSRVRMPNKNSGLFGTWIPSRRALELAATCSIQHTLGPFLDDDIESLFPSPLPLSIKSSSRKKRSNSTSSSMSNSSNNHHLAAITLAALRNPVDHRSAVGVKRDSIDSSSSANNDQLLTHPNNTLKMADVNTLLQAPLLGRFLDTDGDRRITIIDTSVASKNSIPPPPADNTTTSGASNDGDNNSDIDIESEDVLMSDLVRLNDESEDEETDTDNDIEEVRKKMRKIRDAAIAAMEIGNSMQLDDIFQQQHDSSSQPPPLQQESKRRRKHSHGSHSSNYHRKRKRKSKTKLNGAHGNDAESVDDEEEEEEDDIMDLETIKSHFIQSQHTTPYKSFNYSRKRPVGAGGKWSASSAVDKVTPTMIKRSATWSSSMDSPIGSNSIRQRAAIKDVNSLSVGSAMITTTNNIASSSLLKKEGSSGPRIKIPAAKHNSNLAPTTTATSTMAKVSKKKAAAEPLITHTVVNEEDEDEDVDIGGSDNDDDLR